MPNLHSFFHSSYNCLFGCDLPLKTRHGSLLALSLSLSRRKMGTIVTFFVSLPATKGIVLNFKFSFAIRWIPHHVIMLRLKDLYR